MMTKNKDNNKKEDYFFTSESVSEGHPDKICDQISDSILDYCLTKNPNSRVGCEVFATGNKIIIGGEISPMPDKNKIKKIVKNVLDQIGYKDNHGYSYNLCEIEILLQEQSKEISVGVDKKNNQTGAGDQGMMFGYAINESKELMPLSLVIAHELVKTASKLRKENKFKWARPDMKSQVTLKYSNEDKFVKTILMSIQHDENYNKNEFKKFIKKEIIEKVIENYNLKNNYKYDVLINPTGKFVNGGPISDAGLTGRKIIVDTYGGKARHGGGAFSGKDYTKVDRSASYMCRYVAKNIVASGIAKEFELEVCYAIGKPEPLSFWVDSKNTSKYSNAEIIKMIKTLFDFSVSGIIKKLDLKKPIYKATSVYGHFGRNDINFTWEKTDMIKEIKKYFNIN